MGAARAFPARVATDGNTEKLKREIYISNLQSGQIGATALCELMNDVMKKIVPQACHAVGNLPPVLSIVMDTQQKFAFMTMRSEELATAALGLDQMYVLGRPLKISRPAGYFDDPDAKRKVLDTEYVLPAPGKLDEMYAALEAKATGTMTTSAVAAQKEEDLPSSPPLPTLSVRASSEDAAPSASSASTEYLCLENMVNIRDLLSGRERKELRYDIEDECARFGRVIRVVVPTPSDEEVENRAMSKAYVYFERATSAEGAFALMHGRAFGGRRVEARYISAKEFSAVDVKR
jgi:splicing factor U2AF subunit